MNPKVRLLLIEDDPRDAEYFHGLVDSWAQPPVAIELEIHPSCAAAMPRLLAGDYDLLLTDYHLAGATDEASAAPVQDLLVRIVESGKRLPMAIWTGSSRLDVDPRIMKAVLNGQVRFLPKNKFNLGTLRYLVHALVKDAVPIMVVGSNSDLAEQVKQRILMSEFYHFCPLVVSSVTEAASVVQASSPELCLLCGDGAMDELSTLYDLLCARGSTLLLVEDESGDVDEDERLRQWSREHGVGVVPRSLLQDPALAFELVHTRNRFPV